MTAQALAAEFDFSVRTIYRDIDELSFAEVPIYGNCEPNGGVELLDGYRTKLTGLSSSEAATLFLAGLPGPAAELGLADMLMTAQVKLKAASQRARSLRRRGSQGASISIRPPFNRTPVIPEIDFHCRQLGAPTTATYPEPRPNDGHPSASDLVTNASDGVRRVAAAVSRAVAAALEEGVAHGRHQEEP